MQLLPQWRLTHGSEYSPAINELLLLVSITTGTAVVTTSLELTVMLVLDTVCGARVGYMLQLCWHVQ
jgi:hypothetical protein